MTGMTKRAIWMEEPTFSVSSCRMQTRVLTYSYGDGKVQLVLDRD